MNFSGCCKSVKLSATGAKAGYWLSWLGSTFKDTGKEREGAPVYEHKGAYLARNSDSTWRFGTILGDPVDDSFCDSFYKSVGTAECPDSVKQWQYWDGIDGDENWPSGDVSVVCVWGS